MLGDCNFFLVSVITPAHNSAQYIGEAIKSVQNQTVSNWEMLIIDDASTDRTCEIVEKFQINDKRVRLIKLPKNSGPSAARQKGTSEARGRFIAFLDSDDIWERSKLEKQLNFMLQNKYAISSTAYEKINDFGNTIGKIIIPPEKADYERVLLDCPVGNSTVVYDTSVLGKCYGPSIRNREDYGLWLRILKKEKYIWGYPQVLTYYRIRKHSLSRNKLKLVRYHWILYRDFEQLSVIRSIFHIVVWAIIKVLKIK